MPGRSRPPGSACTRAGSPRRWPSRRCWLRRRLPARGWVALPVLLRLPVRRARGDQHAAAQLRRGVAGEPDGAGTPPGVAAHLPPERSDRGRGPASAPSRHTAPRRISRSGSPAPRRSAYVFRRTLWGFGLRAVGAGPRAAEVSGRIDAGRMTAMALLGSGAIAGLAGGVEVSGVSYALYQNLSPGYGFTAIAVALLARLRPLAIVAHRHRLRRARGRAPAPCSGMQVFRRSRCTWSRR